MFQYVNAAKRLIIDKRGEISIHHTVEFFFFFLPHHSLQMSSFIVCLTAMCLSWIYTELILKNMKQSAFCISSIRNKTFMCQIREDSVLYGTVGNPSLD